MLPFLALLPVGKKILQSKIAKNVFKGVGRVFKKKNKGASRAAPANSGIVNAGSLVTQPVSLAIDGPRNQTLGLVEGDGQSLPNKINDWLGTATKSSREINTEVGLDKNTKVFVAVIVGGVLLYLFTKK